VPVYLSSGRQRVTLSDIAGDREQWKKLVALASTAKKQLEDEDLTLYRAQPALVLFSMISQEA